MKKYIIIPMLLFLVAFTVNASPVSLKDKSLAEVLDKGDLLIPIKPTYLTDVTTTAGWDSNWFLEVKGGASAFLGSPIGCGDIFDRVMPVMQLGVGKWFTPAVGGRLGYQGLKFKNANLQSMSYQFVHVDFMYNLTHNLQCNEDGLSKLDVIPFVGLGIIRNSSTIPGYLLTDGESTGNHPFALNYGVELRYLLADRLHLVCELSGMTTMKNFDCVGTSSKLGDNMLNVSVGLSYTIGKKGWKKVIDARPYISQNKYLLDRYAALQCAKMREENDANNHAVDKNDYSGLNSLRYRMSHSGNADGTQSDTLNQSATITIGTPVYFYFKLNSTKLVDASQLANLDEIARIAKEQNLSIHITGAADKATGSEKRNRHLSVERARYIGKQLMKRGVKKSCLEATSLGGINRFSPKEVNRLCIVLLTQ